MKKLLHFGLQRSGTNYLQNLLEKNYQIKMLNNDSDRKHPIQKHFRLYNDKSIIPEPQYENNLTFNSFSEYENALEIKERVDGVVIISKDPYSWFISYFNWAKKCNWPKAKYHYIQEYNNFYSKWIEFSKSEPRIQFVRYVDLLANNEDELDKIKEKFNLSNRFLRSFLKKSNPKNIPQSTTFTNSRLKFYLNEEYLAQIDQSDLNAINSKLDVQLMKELKYEIKKSV